MSYSHCFVYVYLLYFYIFFEISCYKVSIKFQSLYERTEKNNEMGTDRTKIIVLIVKPF